jgi:hypothetical protein
MHPAPQTSPPVLPTSASPTGLLRATEVAQHLRIGIRTVWKLKAIGKLPAVSILGATRFRVEDVARLAQEGVR